MDAFRSQRASVLVATDVAARGVDVDKVNLVVQFDVAHDAPTYLHRVGRCGRFGSTGVSVALSASVQDQRALAKCTLPSALDLQWLTLGGDGACVRQLADEVAHMVGVERAVKKAAGAACREEERPSLGKRELRVYEEPRSLKRNRGALTASFATPTGAAAEDALFQAWLG